MNDLVVAQVVNAAVWLAAWFYYREEDGFYKFLAMLGPSVGSIYGFLIINLGQLFAEPAFYPIGMAMVWLWYIDAVKLKMLPPPGLAYPAILSAYMAIKHIPFPPFPLSRRNFPRPETRPERLFFSENFLKFRKFSAERRQSGQVSGRRGFSGVGSRLGRVLWGGVGLNGRWRFRLWPRRPGNLKKRFGEG